MSSPAVTTAGASAPAAAGPNQLWSTVLNVAWISILLGLAIEVLLILIALGFGRFQALKPFVADGVQKISWSFFVCAGVALGTTAGRLKPAVMGFLGLVAAPLAFHIARTTHKIAAAMLGAAAPGAPLLSLFTLAILKATEYAFLGAAVAWVGKKGGGAMAHTGVGLLTGLVFGGGIMVMNASLSPNPVPAPALFSQAVNEVLFPIGCSLTLFVSQLLAKKQTPSA
jgi:hypothetical protein